MKIRITSHRGDHEAVVEPEVGRAIFDKMTGASEAPLDESVRERVPETFSELARLWEKGKLSYAAIRKDAQGELEAVREFDPSADEVTFLAPITGG